MAWSKAQTATASTYTTPDVFLSAYSMECPFAARHGLNGLNNDRNKRDNSRSGTYGVDRTPSTLFFFKLVWRRAISY
jgi:hypothetical protein